MFATVKFNRLRCTCCAPAQVFYNRKDLCLHRKKMGVTVPKGRPPSKIPLDPHQDTEDSSNLGFKAKMRSYRTPNTARYRLAALNPALLYNSLTLLAT